MVSSKSQIHLTLGGPSLYVFSQSVDIFLRVLSTLPRLRRQSPMPISSPMLPLLAGTIQVQVDIFSTSRSSAFAYSVAWIMTPHTSGIWHDFRLLSKSGGRHGIKYLSFKK